MDKTNENLVIDLNYENIRNYVVDMLKSQSKTKSEWNKTYNQKKKI